jgi:3-dehydroquinate dehydratase I
MICLSVGETTARLCRQRLKGIRFAEVRLDKLEEDPLAAVPAIFAARAKLIATCRPGRIAEPARKAVLFAAIRAGAAFVDVEVESLPGIGRAVVREAHRQGSSVIVSFHDEKGTPPRAALERIVRRAFAGGADVAKVACRARSARENARLLGLLDSARPVVVIGMGAEGKPSRLFAPFLGSPFTFASAASGRETAPGQIPIRALERAVRAIRDAAFEGRR